MQDGDIIALYFKRDERAIEQTAEKYGNYLTTIATNILKDIFDAEECVNDTYVRTWNSIPPTHPSRLSAFLGKITRNIALDRYKEKYAEKRGGRVAECLEELSECVGTSDVEDALAYKELAVLISRFLRSRGELSRKVFVLRYFHQSSISDIARIHSISENHVKTILYRERERLKKLFCKEGIFI